MEDSTSGSINKVLFSHEGNSSSALSEESGWTIYFEEFCTSTEKRKDDGQYIDKSGSITEGGSSIVSDAASNCSKALESGKKLSIRKGKARRVLDDDPFEDTASSPLSSPKVNEKDILNVNQRKIDENRHIFQGEVESYENFTEVKQDVDRANECTELKKRGLCLVPLAMVVDWLG